MPYKKMEGDEIGVSDGPLVAPASDQGLLVCLVSKLNLDFVR